MILEMKVPSPGESITEVEIAQWLVSDGDYVEKDQAIAEVDSDKATLELPAESSGTITLKAEEGDAVAVGAIVCLIDTEGKAPEGQAVQRQQHRCCSFEIPTGLLLKKLLTPLKLLLQQQEKLLLKKEMDPKSIQGTGRGGRITKEDAVKAVPSMGTQPEWGDRGQKRPKLSMLRRKVAERLVAQRMKQPC